MNVREAESLRRGAVVAYTGDFYPDLRTGALYRVKDTNAERPGFVTLEGAKGVYHTSEFERTYLAGESYAKGY
jgi:hypothetical protein